MATDYISREAALDALCKASTPCFSSTGKPILVFDVDYVPAINSIPAADVRPVVVCADCEHNNHCLTQEFVDDCGKIPLDRSTFFCADGERKSDV